MEAPMEDEIVGIAREMQGNGGFFGVFKWGVEHD
jgi:hypothetical protein